MPKKDPRVDAYITKAPEFARPILIRLRAAVHAACPEVEESIKWGMPSFAYHGILCGMAAFKRHAAFGFWKSKLVLDRNGKPADESMGRNGRLTSIDDLPPRRTLEGYIRAAMRLNAAGVTVPRRAARTKPSPRTPSDFSTAIRRSARAQAAYARFSPSMKREYIQWIVEAKTDPTRQRRIETAVAWIADGKQRNWKYATKR